MIQANQFWFYALSFSLLGTLYTLFSQLSSPTSPVSGEKETNGTNEKGGPAPVESSALVRQFVVDGCDIVIPLGLLNWMSVGDLTLGLTMVVSTGLTGRAIWVTV